MFRSTWRTARRQRMRLPGIGGVMPTPTYLVALLGQSNSVGRADEDSLTDSSYSAAFSGVQLKQQNAATPADPLVWTSYVTADLQPRTDHATQNMGPELSMGRYLDAAAPGDFALVKVGIGSSGLNDHWKPTSLYPAIGGDPNLFTQAVEFIQEAESEFARTLSAIVWVQGESDALDATDAAAYETNLTALITALRVTWPSVPFVYNRLNSSHTYTHKATVRTAQANVDAAVSGTTMVDADGIALQGDGDHYTADGYIELGERLAAAVLAQLSLNVPPVAAWSSSASGRDLTFTDASTDDDGTVTSWLWSFGDATTSTSQNPTHTYSANGVYSVTLTVTDSSGGTDSLTSSVVAVAPTWDVDATSSKGVPNSSAQWSTVITDNALTNWSAPNSLFLCQEASGDLADSIGSITLTANATPVYAQAVSGWTRTAVGTTDGTANQRFRSTQAGLPDLGTTSMLVLAYVAVTNNPASTRGVMGIGNPAGIERRAAVGTTSSLARAVAGSTSTSATEGGTAVRPIIIKIDRTGSTALYYSNIEKLSPTFGTPAGKLLDLGATIGASPATNRYLYAAMWSGSAAERSDQDIRDLLEALGWTVTGYGS